MTDKALRRVVIVCTQLSEVGKTGIDQAGTEQVGIYQACIELAGIDQADTELTGIELAGMDEIGTGKTGREFVDCKGQETVEAGSKF